MSKLTKDLLERTKDLIKVYPEVSDSTGHYHMFDDGGVEVETAEFLWGLIRLLQPEQVLETGTYTGISALYMAQALADNGHGHLVTLEVEDTHRARAEKLWRLAQIEPYVNCVLQPSLDFQTDLQYDFIFLDSEPEFRFKELVKFYSNLKPGGYFIVHDLHRHLSQQPHEMFFGWPYAQLPEQIVTWIKNDDLRVVSFPTPRGLSGFYKPRKGEDYNPTDGKFNP